MTEYAIVSYQVVEQLPYGYREEVKNKFLYRAEFSGFCVPKAYYHQLLKAMGWPIPNEPVRWDY